MAQSTDRIPPDDKAPGCFGVLIRLFWLYGGVVILIFSGVDIALRGNRAFTIVLYWLAVVAIMVARFVDIRFFHGETYNGKPATMKHWRRHVVLILAFSSIFFVVLMLI